MRRIFHTLMIWLMLLAVPLQGFAAASMPLCEAIGVIEQDRLHPTAIDQSVETMHHHGEMVTHHDHAHHGSTNHSSTASSYATAKCGVCAACCVGATMTFSAVSAFQPRPAVLERLLSASSFPVSIIPSSLERPPQTLFV